MNEVRSDGAIDLRGLAKRGAVCGTCELSAWRKQTSAISQSCGSFAGNLRARLGHSVDLVSI